MLVPEEEKEGYRREFRHFATQFASAISRIEVDDGQWVGRLFRVYGKFKAENAEFGLDEPPKLPEEPAALAVALEEREGIDRKAADEVHRFQEFLRNENISELEISDVTYEIDPDDKEGLHYFAKGYLDIKKSDGRTFVAGRRYAFRHRIKKTYHTRETVIEDLGEIPGVNPPVAGPIEPPTD